MLRPAPQPEPALLTVLEVSQMLSVSRPMVYRMLDLGQLPSLRIGTSRRIRRVDVEKFIETAVEFAEQR